MKGVLGDIATLQVGFPFKSADFVPEGVRLLRGDNIGQGFLRWDQAARWKHAEPSEYLLRPDDVVIAMDRPWIGAGLKFARVRPADLPALLVQRVAVLRAKPGTHQRFLESAIRDSRFAAYIQSVQTGTAVPHISGEQILNYRLALRPFGEQEAIAEVLGALDDKIAANGVASATADALLTGLVTNALNRESREARFLDAVEVEFGEPFAGQHFSSPNEGMPLIRIRDLIDGVCDVWTTEVRSRQTVVEPGDLLVGMDAEFRVHPWIGRPGVVNQRVMRISSELLGNAVLREVVRAPLASLEQSKSATTVIHLNKRDLEAATVRLPAPHELPSLKLKCDPIFRARVQAALESRALSELRDALLPLLMAGQVRVRDAERAVEGVL